MTFTAIVWSKAQFMTRTALCSLPYEVLYVIASGKSGTPKDTLYFWGKGVCKHKTGDCRLRRLTGQKRSIRRAEGNHIIKPTQDTFVLAWKKAHTSKRVNIIACNNVISKAQCAPCGRVSLLLPYFSQNKDLSQCDSDSTLSQRAERRTSLADRQTSRQRQHRVPKGTHRCISNIAVLSKSNIEIIIVED